MNFTGPFFPLGASVHQTHLHDLLVAQGAYDLPAGFRFEEETLTIFRNTGTDRKPRWEKDDFRTAKLRAAVGQEKTAAALADKAALFRLQHAAYVEGVIRQDQFMDENVTAEVIDRLREEKRERDAAAALARASTAYAPTYGQPRATSARESAAYGRPRVTLAYAPAPAAVRSAPAVYAAPLSTLPAPLPAAVPLPEPVTPDPAQLQREQEMALVAQAAGLVRAWGPYAAALPAYASQLSAAGRSAEAGRWLDYARALDSWLANLRLTYNVS